MSFTLSCEKIHIFTLRPLSQRCNVTNLSLSYRYFHDNCSGELHSLIPPILAFISRIRNPTAMESHQLYSLCISIVRKKFLLDSISHELMLTCGCFPKCEYLNHFMSIVNLYLPYRHNPTFYSYINITHCIQ